MWPFRKKTATVVLKTQCDTDCPFCGGKTQILGYTDSEGEIERMEQKCVTCGGTFSRLHRERPSFEMSLKQAKKMFGG